MNILVIDIETLPTTNPVIIQNIVDNVKPPSNYKKSDVIRDWYKTTGRELQQNAVMKTALNGLYGSVVCISIGFMFIDYMNNNSVESMSVNSFSKGDEPAIIKDAYAYIDTLIRGVDSSQIGIAGHNLLAFDLPFLLRRSMIHRIKFPSIIARTSLKPANRSPYYYDTMRIFGSDYKDMVSLKDLCHAFLIDFDDSVNGSMVFDLYQEGRIADIVTHCENDVNAVIQLLSTYLSLSTN